MGQISYDLKRAYLILWRWQTLADGQPTAQGMALTRPGARAAARHHLRSKRAPLADWKPQTVSEG